MSETDQGKLFLKLSALSILLGCLLFFSSERPRFAYARVAFQSPVISIQAQKNSPLQFSSVQVDSNDPRAPQLNFIITNVSHKSIRAFTLIRDTETEHGRSSAATLTHRTSLRKLLQRGQSEAMTDIGATTAEPVKSITLLVDFVEFQDGTTWGLDTHKSSERLAGQRAGGRAMIDRFRKKLETEGSAPLIQALTANNDEVVPPLNRSPEWKDGFRTGIGVVHHRLQGAKSKGGVAEVEFELRQPYDASEGRPQ